MSLSGGALVCQIYLIQGESRSGREVKRRPGQIGATASLRRMVGGHPSQHPSPSQILWSQEIGLESLENFSFSLILAGNVVSVSNHLEILI